VVRTVVLDGAPRARSLHTIEAALKHDPLATSFRVGGMLLGEEIVAS
jgi:hypothetical protein